MDPRQWTFSFVYWEDAQVFFFPFCFFCFFWGVQWHVEQFLTRQYNQAVGAALACSSRSFILCTYIQESLKFHAYKLSHNSRAGIIWASPPLSPLKIFKKKKKGKQYVWLPLLLQVIIDLSPFILPPSCFSFRIRVVVVEENWEGITDIRPYQQMAMVKCSTASCRSTSPSSTGTMTALFILGRLSQVHDIYICMRFQYSDERDRIINQFLYPWSMLNALAHGCLCSDKGQWCGNGWRGRDSVSPSTLDKELNSI